ncbi:MAG TPA: potassium channel family protein, partial [Blastocatellia bacterium]
MSPRNKFQLAFSAIAGLIAFGTVGYKLLIDLPWFDCFYFTLITLTTIGYGEAPGMTEPARYFTAVLILSGVGTIGYALSIAARAVLEFELVATFG